MKRRGNLVKAKRQQHLIFTVLYNVTLPNLKINTSYIPTFVNKKRREYIVKGPNKTNCVFLLLRHVQILNLYNFQLMTEKECVYIMNHEVI